LVASFLRSITNGYGFATTVTQPAHIRLINRRYAMTPPLIMDWKMLTNLSLQAAVSRKKEVVDRCFFIDSVNHIRRYIDFYFGSDQSLGLFRQFLGISQLSLQLR
jgi:hypothetical protein